MDNCEDNKIPLLESKKYFNKHLLNQCRIVSLLCTLVLPQTGLSASNENLQEEPIKKMIDFTSLIEDVDKSDKKISESFGDLFERSDKFTLDNDSYPHTEIIPYSQESYLIEEERTAKDIVKLGGIFLKKAKNWVLYKIPELRNVEHIVNSVRTPFSVSNDSKIKFFDESSSNSLLKLELNPKIGKDGNKYELSSNSSISLEYCPNDQVLDYSAFLTKDGFVGVEIKGEF